MNKNANGQTDYYIFLHLIIRRKKTENFYNKKYSQI